MNRFGAPTIMLMSLVFVGCGSGEQRTPTFEVHGKLTDGSKPVANAQIVFHAVNGTAGTPKPSGKTDANGEFKLTTYVGNDGAPAGQYKVSVELWKTTSADAGPVNQLPVKYADPDKSGLTASVTAGPNELQPFVLKK